MITFYDNHGPIPYAPDLSLVGYLPSFLDERDPDPAAKQIDKNYQHGGGWHPQKGWELLDAEWMVMKYPGDPAVQPIAVAKLRDERLYFYPHQYLCIIQPDRSFEMARVD